MARTTTGASLRVRRAATSLRNCPGPLDDLSFVVPAGKVVGFLGPNGAGKTTTMRAIFGLTDLDAGSVRWNGVPVGASPAPPVRLYAGGAGPVPEHARGRRGRVPGPTARHGQEQRCHCHQAVAGAPGRGRPGHQQGGNPVPRQPAAGAAGGGPGARPRGAGAGRAARRSGPDRHRCHRRGARRAGSFRAMRAVLEPPTRPGRGPLRVGGHHRPRSAGGEGDRRRVGN